jgi:hypothetical protein
MAASRPSRHRSRRWTGCLAVVPVALFLIGVLDSAASAAPQGQVPDCGPMDVMFVVNAPGACNPPSTT